MPRKGYIAKREVLPDPIYNSKVVTKLVNNIMLDGKKSVAQKIVYDAFDIIKEKEGKNPLGLRWLVTYARNRHEKTMAEKLAGEIMDAVAGNGGAFKKKEDTHRMAEANKAFAHYKW